MLVAIGVNEESSQEILGTPKGLKEDRQSWKNYFIWLKSHGLQSVRLIIGDKNPGMLESIPEVFPVAAYQRCTVHFYRNIFSVIPRKKMCVVSLMLKAIHAQESKAAAQEKARRVADKLREMKLSAAARKVEESIEYPNLYELSYRALA